MLTSAHFFETLLFKKKFLSSLWVVDFLRAFDIDFKNMHSFINVFWYKNKKKNRLLSLILFFLSQIYRLGLSLKLSLDKKKTAKIPPVPLVSVGNLSVGGEGKTPLVIKIASFFIDIGLKPAVISRGYGRKKMGTFSVDIKKHCAASCGDEPYLLAKNLRCPIIVGKKRERAIEKAVKEFGIDIAILDDGFQVRDLKKDVEVVVLKVAREFLNFNLFPLGPMREPIENIKRSDIIVLNCGFGKMVQKVPENLFGSIPVFYAHLRVLNLLGIRDGMYRDYKWLKGKEVVAFSGLADNDSFFRLVENIGAKLKFAIPFPDHHFYKKKDIERILSHKADLYITTEKDAVKLTSLDVPENFYSLSVEMVIEGERDFFSLILEKIEKNRGESIWKKGFTSSTLH